MPNWCYTNYIATGDKDEVADLREKMNGVINAPKSLLENDFGALWLGNLVHIFGGNPEEIYCRGSIIDVADEVDEGEFLSFRTETAWSDMRETFDFIESKYNTIKFFFFAEETSACGYWTNDKDGEHFTERYIVEQWDEETMEHETLEEVLEDIYDRTGKVVSSFEEAELAIGEFNEDEENKNSQIYIYKVSIVD